MHHSDKFHIAKLWTAKAVLLARVGQHNIKTHDSESRGQEETAIIHETKNT